MNLDAVRGLNTFWKALDDYRMVSDWTDRRPHQLVEKTDDTIVLYISAPGYTNDDLNVEVHDGKLSVTGDVTEPPTDLIAKAINLSFSISEHFVVDSASIENGVLAITMSRHEKATKVKIPVTARK